MTYVMTVIMMLCSLYIVTCFFCITVNEMKCRKWFDVKKKIPRHRKKDGEEERFLVSTSKKDVLIASYNFQKRTFNIPDVTAWRRIPKAYDRNIFSFLLFFKKDKKR